MDSLKNYWNFAVCMQLRFILKHILHRLIHYRAGSRKLCMFIWFPHFFLARICLYLHHERDVSTLTSWERTTHWDGETVQMYACINNGCSKPPPTAVGHNCRVTCPIRVCRRSNDACPHASCCSWKLHCECSLLCAGKCYTSLRTNVALAQLLHYSESPGFKYRTADRLS